MRTMKYLTQIIQTLHIPRTKISLKKVSLSNRIVKNVQSPKIKKVRLLNGKLPAMMATSNNTTAQTIDGTRSHLKKFRNITKIFMETPTYFAAIIVIKSSLKL